MKIAELNNIHFSPETLDKLQNNKFEHVKSILWFESTGLLIMIEDSYKLSIALPYDLVNVIEWIKKNKYQYALISPDAPILNSLAWFVEEGVLENDPV